MKSEAEKAADRALGAFVHKARVDAGLTSKQLAAQAHVAASAISRLERGIRSMRTSGLSRIADSLRLNLAEMLAVRGFQVGRGAPWTLRGYLKVRYGLSEVALDQAEKAVERIVAKDRRPNRTKTRRERTTKRSEGGEI